MMPIAKLAHRTCFFISRTVYMTCCCGCCSALRPRYKRLVDNIFPASPQDGLVKSNMEKLTFYSLSSPEKLDRIGEYLYQKACRDIYRRRHGFVIIAMEAMDQLLLACHSQTLNLFVESFLKMVQKLLESTDPPLQILATQSFVRFANIEEDTPSYHRRYDFFVSKFSAMCHSNHSDKPTREKIRLAGIQGLQGVIRKTVSDDLVENIWEAQHMDKIVPSLLYNMQTAEKYTTVMSFNPESATTPARLAELCLRDLLARASFGHIPNVLRPVLTHFDGHELWVPNDFAIHTFKIMMFSIQAQYSYSVVETLLQHVDSTARAGVRAARAGVLSHIVTIAAADSIGPSVLEIINNLLTNLRASVARDSDKESDEKLYQDALINALGEFADHLPDFQKIDIMMFIISKVPAVQRGKPSRADNMLQSILLKSLLKVGTTYKTTEYSKAFPAAFLEALLRISQNNETSTRVLLQRILQTLFDRKENKHHFITPAVDYSDVDLTIEKCSRQDLIFISKHGYAIFSSLYEGLQLESNTVENIEAIFTTLALMIVELGCEETIGDILQLILSLQQSAQCNPVLSVPRQCALQAACASLAALVARITPTGGALSAYVQQIIEARRSEGPHLLPPLLEDYDLTPDMMPNKLPFLMFDHMAVCESVRACGMELGRLQAPSPYAAGGPQPHAHRHSWVEAGATQGRDSLADITAGPLTEMDSANSSPGVQRRSENEFWHWDHSGEHVSAERNEHLDINRHPHQAVSESISLEALRRAATGPTEAERREQERQKASLNYTFRTAPFDQLIHLTQPKYEIQDKLQEIFKSLSEEPLLAPTTVCSPQPGLSHHYNNNYPDLFLY